MNNQPGSDEHSNGRSADDATDDAGGARPLRRARYRGTHPRRFEERYKELQAASAAGNPEILDHVRAQGRTPAGTHVPVLSAEVIEVLRTAAGQVVADCTVGHGGHALELLRRIQPSGKLIGLDVDAVELARAANRLREARFTVALTGRGERRRATTPPAMDAAPAVAQAHLIHGNFAGLAQAAHAHAPQGFDAILADLGASSMQIDDDARGFSYKHDGPLDMRMDATRPRSATDILATIAAVDLSDALRDLADEPDHESIAAAIIEQRRAAPLRRTRELVELVLQAKGVRRTKRTGRDDELSQTDGVHPAARTFQALRILVNDELAALRNLLRVAPDCLRPGGRLAIITFHSGEDRLVKKSLAEQLERRVYAEISREALRPGASERRDNPRSSSAKLRWAERSGAS